MRCQNNAWKSLRFTCYVRDIGSFKSRLCKIVYSKQYNIFNTLCMVLELVIKPKTMTLNKHLALHNWHLLALRTGQSGVTDFYFLIQRQYTFVWLSSPKKGTYSETTTSFCTIQPLSQIPRQISSVEIRHGNAFTLFLH